MWLCWCDCKMRRRRGIDVHTMRFVYCGWLGFLACQVQGPVIPEVYRQEDVQWACSVSASLLLLIINSYYCTEAMILLDYQLTDYYSRSWQSWFYFWWTPDFLRPNICSLNLAIIIFVNFAVFVLILTSKLLVPSPLLSFILNLTTATHCTVIFHSLI